MGFVLHLCLSVCLFPKYLEYQAIHVKSPPSFSYHPLSPYGIHIRGRDWITFQVKAISNAIIGFQSYYNRTDAMYEVVIGGWRNTKSAIRRISLGPPKAQALGIELSNDEYRQFWVAWTSGNITVGRGSDLGSDIIMYWTDPLPRVVSYLAVTSWHEVSVEWRFEIPICKEQLKFAVLKKNAIYNSTNARIISANDVAPSPANCVFSCYSKPWCRGFSYGYSGHECDMFDVAPVTEDLEDSDEWETWSLVW